MFSRTLEYRDRFPLLLAALGVGLGTFLHPPSIPLARHWEIGLSTVVVFGEGLSGSERESQGFLGYLQVQVP